VGHGRTRRRGVATLPAGAAMAPTRSFITFDPARGDTLGM